MLADYAGQALRGVKIGTFHRAKGLEFERVYIPRLGGNYPRYPDEDSIVRHGIALYVAMSRARDHLVLTHAYRPSTYIEAIESSCEEFVHIHDVEMAAA